MWVGWREPDQKMKETPFIRCVKWTCNHCMHLQEMKTRGRQEGGRDWREGEGGGRGEGGKKGGGRVNRREGRESEENFMGVYYGKD